MNRCRESNDWGRHCWRSLFERYRHRSRQVSKSCSLHYLIQGSPKGILPWMNANQSEITCPECLHRIGFDVALSGTAVTCPRCSKPIRLPSWDRPIESNTVAPLHSGQHLQDRTLSKSYLWFAAIPAFALMWTAIAFRGGEPGSAWVIGHLGILAFVALISAVISIAVKARSLIWVPITAAISIATVAVSVGTETYTTKTEYSDGSYSIDRHRRISGRLLSSRIITDTENEYTEYRGSYSEFGERHGKWFYSSTRPGEPTRYLLDWYWNGELVSEREYRHRLRNY